MSLRSQWLLTVGCVGQVCVRLGVAEVGERWVVIATLKHTEGPHEQHEREQTEDGANGARDQVRQIRALVHRRICKEKQITARESLQPSESRLHRNDMTSCEMHTVRIEALVPTATEREAGQMVAFARDGAVDVFGDNAFPGEAHIDLVIEVALGTRTVRSPHRDLHHTLQVVNRQSLPCRQPHNLTHCGQCHTRQQK